MKNNVYEDYQDDAAKIIRDWHESREWLRRELNDPQETRLIDLTIAICDKYRLSKIPWYLRDKYGYPVERLWGQPVRNFIRIILANIRKLS